MDSDLEKENWVYQKAVKLPWYFPRSCSEHYFEKLLKNRITPHLGGKYDSVSDRRCKR